MALPVVGLIGCGHIGRFHSRNLRASIRSELVAADYVAVCDRQPERAAEFARITGARVITADAAEVFAQPGLTAVYVCTETAEHPALVLEAARRGLAVFCEKPLARTLPEVQEMHDAVSAAGVTNQVGLVLRHSPVFTVLKGLIAAPDLGPLLTAHLRDDQFFPDHGHYQSAWRNDFELAGGGTLIEHSIHDIDLFHWLFGPIESLRCHMRVTSGHDRIEDVAVATFQHAGGHQTTLSSIWHQVDARPSTRRLEIFFEGGWFATDHDFIGPIRYQLRSGLEAELSAEQVFDRYAELTGLSEAEAALARIGAIEDYLFLKAATVGQPAFPDFTTALAAHRVVDACYRSAREGTAMPVTRR